MWERSPTKIKELHIKASKTKASPSSKPEASIGSPFKSFFGPTKVRATTQKAETNRIWSKSPDNPSPQKAKKQKEPKKRRKQLQSKTPQTPTLVRGKVFKPILKQSKRKPKLGSRRRPTSSIPSIPQPPSPDIQKNPGRKRRGREKTPELPEVSR